MPRIPLKTMALRIKTGEAERLARALAQITGETMTEAVTAALRERLAGERVRREAAADLPARLVALSMRLRADYDTRPMSKAEWEEASGEDAA
jgi:antitoxin VapB